MRRKTGFCMVLLALLHGALQAQSFGSVDNAEAERVFDIDSERGFTAQTEINTNLFQMTSVDFSDEKQRFLRSGHNLIDNYPFGGINILDGTNIGFAYNSGWYGGNLSVNSGGLGGIKVWIGFLGNKLKISAGNDLGYGYADSQGADAGLRVYDDSVRNTGEGQAENSTIDTNKNPDNITRDQGILFEVELAQIKIALAGGGNFTDMAKNMGSSQMIRTSTYGQDPVYGHRLQYGANIGGRIGDYVKLNGAYILQSEKDHTSYMYLSNVQEIVPKLPDTEMTTHYFGAYASAYPFGNNTLGITLGYAGILVQYLDTYYGNDRQPTLPSTVDGFKTVYPQIMKNGLNFSARYQTDKFVVKTDHNYSFWIDKNYRIFNLHKPDASLVDYGLRSADSIAADFSDVSHSFLWNGIGASYNFTDVIEGSVYSYNLIRIDETPQYRMFNDYFSVELRSTFRFSSNVEAYIGFVYQFTDRIVSKELSERVGEFAPDTSVSPAVPREAKETNDTRNMFKVPIGFKVKLQK